MALIRLLLRALAVRLTPLTFAFAMALATSFASWSTAALAGPNDGLPKSTHPLDRTTPRRAVEGFLAASRAGDFALAANYLDLRNIGKSAQAAQGAELAQKLSYVIERKMPLELATLSDAPDGAPMASAGSVHVGDVMVDEEAVPISLTRVRFDDGTQRWLVSRTTLAMVPGMYATYGAASWENMLPRWLRAQHVFGVELWQWLALVAALALGGLFGWLLVEIGALVMRPLAARTTTPWDDRVLDRSRRPARMITAAATVELAVPRLHLVPFSEEIGHRLSYTLFVLGLAWLALAGLGLVAELLHSRVPKTDDPAELASRGLRTQLFVAQRIVSVVVVVLATAVLLMQFEVVRSVGVSLLASAGVAGVVLGFAAQRSLSGVIAGIQLSITQPIRLGDTVIVEGEYGTIEEINLTYVVVRVWDERRLIVPITQFLEKPFQNWTKVDPALTGVVLLHVDYATPVARVREELAAIVAASSKWDGRVATVVVFDSTEKVMVVRATVSARNPSDTFDLRCEVREKLIAFLQSLENGRYLPVVRTVDERAADVAQAAVS